MGHEHKAAKEHEREVEMEHKHEEETEHECKEGIEHKHEEANVGKYNGSNQVCVHKKGRVHESDNGNRGYKSDDDNQEMEP